MTLTEQTPGEDPDRIADEFLLLIDAAAGRAEEYLRGLGRAPDAERERCESCPVCALLAVLRGGGTARLTEQLADLVTALRETLAEHQATPEQPPEPDAASGKVQRIQVQRVAGSVLDEGVRPGESGC